MIISLIVKASINCNSNQQIVDANAQATEDKDIPLLSIDEDGYWNYLLGGTSAVLTDLQGNPAPALSKTGKGIFTPQIALGKDGLLAGFLQWNSMETFR